ncbi:SMODS domain-containing nucleotidyltransferase [Aquimarina spongiae]|uniref:SMODS and SLOG-associating 2TM effector domain-containing protein n=1 Tax=Aquimarina spongiae TaxID=570521 RepID=A0A1M6BK84_9FLAO|nr:hypothetical protein [Aquimarina spongiae]SHI49121.1 hypothetical protein SAMN04488508_101880 [Aquimarina spongiae]
MNISTNFNVFCDRLQVSEKKKSIITLRYNAICKKLNNDFWDLNTDDGGIYVGSYGRGTASGNIDTVEMIFEMPSQLLSKYTNAKGKAQFKFLESVRKSIAAVYPNTTIENGDFGIRVRFFDGMYFFIAPVFYKDNTHHLYADLCKGGSWKEKNFRKEEEIIKIEDEEVYHNFTQLCKMAKAWKWHCEIPIEDALIDTLVCNFLNSWSYKKESYSYYDIMCKDFFEFLTNQRTFKKEWNHIGGFLVIPNALNFRYKAIMAYHKAESAIIFSRGNEPWLAAQKWKEIFGNDFPDTVAVNRQLKELKNNVLQVNKAQKAWIKKLERQRLIVIVAQILSGVMIPGALVALELFENFNIGFMLFMLATTVFIITLAYRKTNHITTILRHKVSASFTSTIQQQLQELIRDFNDQDIDVAIIKDKKQKIISKLRSLCIVTPTSSSKKYIEAIHRLREKAFLRNYTTNADVSGYFVPSWSTHQFQKEGYIQPILNYQN